MPPNFRWCAANHSSSDGILSAAKLSETSMYTPLVSGVTRPGAARWTVSVLLVLCCWPVALAAGTPEAGATHSIPFFPATANPNGWEGFVRVVNHSSVDGSVSIRAFDDGGRDFGILTLAIDAGGTVHFNSADLEDGNASKGLSGRTGDNAHNDWRLELTSDLRIAAMAYVRTSDGMLTAMHDAAPNARGDASVYRVVTFNPGSNTQQQSLLRLVNRGDAEAAVSIRGVDDRGRSAGPVRVGIAARASRTVTALELEEGDRGLDGVLGDGAGKWRLEVESDTPLLAMSLLASPTGHLTNLSTVPQVAAGSDGAGAAYRIPFFPAAANARGWQGFVRLANHSDEDGTVSIRAFDDAGREFDTLTLAIDAGETVHLNSADLEDGNLNKGLPGGTGGPGEGDWRLTISSDLPIEAMAYVRTSDGLLAAMHDVAPTAEDSETAYRVVTFNPGSNDQQQSLLRLVNPGAADALVSIRGVDDLGQSAGPVRLNISAGASRTVSALELEEDSADGTLGDGGGKWRLDVESDVPVLAMSLLASPTGHLTNLSTVPVVVAAPQSSGVGSDPDFTPVEEFNLPDHGTNRDATGRGITYANERFYILVTYNGAKDRVYAYTASGQRDPTADFDLHEYMRFPNGIAFANGRFHLIDRLDRKVYAYTASGQRDPAADFDLHRNNGYAKGIAFVNGRFHVVDWYDEKVYVYTASGRHDPAADFDLDEDNTSARGITFANGRFYVPDSTDHRVYAYTASGQRDSAADFDLPDGKRSAGGIIYANGRLYVLAGSDEHVYSVAVGGTDTGGAAIADSPSFAGVRSPDDQVYILDSRIDALTLPAARGGNGTLTYALAPSVPGLSFNRTARRLTGTPTRAGTYNMTYTVEDADGDSDSIEFTIEVLASDDTFVLENGECEAEPSVVSGFYDLTLRGTIRARVSFSSTLYVLGYANGDFVGYDSLRPMSAGETQDFEITNPSFRKSGDSLDCHVAISNSPVGDVPQGPRLSIVPLRDSG